MNDIFSVVVASCHNEARTGIMDFSAFKFGSIQASANTT
jgi:hypothetical protein